MNPYLAVQDALYAPESAEDLAYVRSGLDVAAKLLGDNEIGNSIMQDVRKTFDSYHGVAAMQHRAMARRSYDTRGLREDTIAVGTSLESLQTANPVMQQWIMCDPKLKKMYRKKRIDGYSGSYRDEHPDKLGKTDPRYQSLIDGVVLMDEDSWEVTQYSKVEHPISTADKDAVFTAQRSAKAYAQTGKPDPTSKYNARVA